MALPTEVLLQLNTLALAHRKVSLMRVEFLLNFFLDEKLEHNLPTTCQPVSTNFKDFQEKML